MTRPTAIAIALLAGALAACQGSSSPTCGFNGATTLAPTTWPKFRADPANTARANVDLTASAGVVPMVLFQARCSITTSQPCTDTVANSDCPSGQTCMAIGPVTASPVLSPDPSLGTRVYIASGAADGTVYALDLNGQPVATAVMRVPGGVLGTPLAGADSTLFVPGTGTLIQFLPDGTARTATGLSGTVAGSPNLWNFDGTAYVGTTAGTLAGVCPNGVARFAVSFPQTQSTAAVVQDPNVPATNVTPIIVGGGSNGTVRAYTKKGKQYWSFFATNDVVAAIMIDELQDPEVFYAADTNGRVFAVNVGNGRPLTQFSFATDGGAAITASPALGRDASTTMAGTTMYVGDQGGILYALNRFTGDELWRFQADGPINSSPAVAIGGSQDVIVFAADGPTASRMYAIRDDGTEGTSLWTGQDGEPGVTACGVVGASSPAIAADGTVYVGLQTIATNSTECEAVVQTNGGALVAFAP